MKDRTARVARKTKETDILIELNLDNGKKGQPNSSKQGQPSSSNRGQIDTTIGFLDHMLDLFSAHSGIFLKIKAKGDTHIDDHHLVEDIGIALGNALQQALGDKKGIARYGQVLLPMDEALCYIALDLSGRFYLSYEAKILFQKTGFNYDLLEDFFYALSENAKMTLHIKMLKGRNNHHIAESIFKGFGRALKAAIARSNKAAIPSTKGVL